MTLRPEATEGLAGETILAVDIGNTSTIATLGRPGHPGPLPWPDGALYRTIPSAVWVNADGVVVAGDDAQRGAIQDPSRGERSPKPYVGQGTILLAGSSVATVDMLAALLKRVVDEAGDVIGGHPGELRLTHPAGWAAGRRRELVAAARATGVDQIRLIPEPVAAAAEVPGTRPGALVGVVDIGADSVRAFLLRRREAGFEFVGPPAVLESTGGDLVDAAILTHLEAGRLGRHQQWAGLRQSLNPSERAAAAALMCSVQQAKVTLGQTLATEIEGPTDTARMQITRSEVDEIVGPVAENAVGALEARLREAGLTTADLDALVLVGGTSGFPIVADIVWGRTGTPPTVPVDPEAAISRGAAMAPLATGAGGVAFYPRLAADPVVAGWNRGADVFGCVAVTKGSLQVTVRDRASSGGVEALAAATARSWAATNRGYAEQALYPMTVLETRGLERRFEIDGDHGPQAYSERYAVLEGRSIVITAPDPLRHILEGIRRRPAYSGVAGRYESLISVEVPRGWSAAEELVVVRHETGQRASAESEALTAKMTADSWIAARVAKADQVPGYVRVNAGYATFLGDLPATLVTYQHYPSPGRPDCDTYVRRLWLGVVDGIGYQVTATSSYHDQSVGTFAAYSAASAHLTLVDRPPNSDLLVRAGVALNNKLAGLRRFWREVAPQPQ